MDAGSLLPILTVIILFAFGFLLGVMRRKQGDGGSGSRGDTADAADMASFMPSRPLTPSFQVSGWDGYTGIQLAVAVALSDGECYPLIEAGTEPPVSTTTTFSTASGDQEIIRVRLFAALEPDTSKAQRFGTVVIGPVPVTGEAIRSVDLAISVAPDGTVEFAATFDGEEVDAELTDQYLGALPVGR